jgi:hypothetical protein
MERERIKELTHEITGLVLEMTNIYQFNFLTALMQENLPQQMLGDEKQCEQAKWIYNQMKLVAEQRISDLAECLECDEQDLRELSELLEDATGGQSFEMAHYLHMEKLIGTA